MSQILELVLVLGCVSASCCRLECKRKEFLPQEGLRHSGQTLVVYEYVPLQTCVVGCRRYLGCRSFNMRWMNPERTIGTCTLLKQISMSPSDIGAAVHDNYTHYYWCPSTMSYLPSLGICMAYKTGLDWYKGLSFCDSLYPGAHLIDVESEEEQNAFADEFGSLQYDYVWTSGKRPDNGGQDEFYWMNSGKPFNYSTWMAGQPFEGSPTSDCVGMWKEQEYRWGDDGCELEDRVTACEW